MTVLAAASFTGAVLAGVGLAAVVLLVAFAVFGFGAAFFTALTGVAGLAAGFLATGLAAGLGAAFLAGAALDLGAMALVTGFFVAALAVALATGLAADWVVLATGLAAAFSSMPSK